MIKKKTLQTQIRRLYGELQLLLFFTKLNYTGFRKVTKKFEKRTQGKFFEKFMLEVVKSKFVDQSPINDLDEKIQRLYSLISQGTEKVESDGIEVGLLDQDQDRFIDSKLKSMDLNFKKLLDPEKELHEVLEKQRSMNILYIYIYI